MPNPSSTPTPITPPRVPLIDPRTGLIDRAWYLFFLSLLNAADAEGNSVQANVASLMASYDAALAALNQYTKTLPPEVDCCADVDSLRQELGTQPRQELGTMAALQQANLPWVTFDTTAEHVPPDIGTIAWDGGTTLGVQATASVLIRVGESEYVYAKASSAITKGQLCYHTGAVGASGVVTVAPTPLALTDPNQLVGVAAESIALNGFGLIQISGDLKGFNTTGSSVGETWADGDPLYYNPAYVGGMTKVKPTAPNQKSYIGEVINAGSGGSGSMHVRLVPGTVLGGTDSNVEISSPVDGDVLTYVNANLRWENKPVSISLAGLSSATTPLAGTELVLVSQSGTNKKTTVENVLTATVPSGAANGIYYLNGSKILTSGSSFTFDGSTETITTTNVAYRGQLSLNGGAGGFAQATFYKGATTNTDQLAAITAADAATPYLAFNGRNNTVLVWQLNDTEKMRLDATGLGIGTTTPANPLHIVKDNTASRGQLSLQTSTASNFAQITFYDQTTLSAQIYQGYGVDKALVLQNPLAHGVAVNTNNVERFRVDAAGNVRVNTGAVGTTATDGFLYVPTCAGTPTGTPTTVTGLAPIVVDSTNNKLYFYSGGAWRDAGP